MSTMKKEKPMSKVVVQVTQLDIKKGKPGDPCGCPVARALKRAFQDRRVSAGEGYIWVGPSSRRMTWRTPGTVRYFISQFDEGQQVEPLSFTLGNELRVPFPDEQKG
jgi:hypothetical protein